MKDFHRVVFKADSFDECIAKAHEHLMKKEQLELACELLRLDITTHPGEQTSGFTTFVWGKLEPRPYNNGHTHFLRVKWYQKPSSEKVDHGICGEGL